MTLRSSEHLRTAFIDVDAIAHNVRTMREVLGVPNVFAVVKANAYGHGAIVAARAAVAAGVDGLAVVDIDEALELRDAGINAPILCWLHPLNADFGRAVREQLDIGICRFDQLDAVADAVAALREAGDVTAVARVQLKVETGLSRNGLAPGDWQRSFERARDLQQLGLIEVIGIFSHLSNTSPEDDAAAAQRFESAVSQLAECGVEPELVHLASSGPASKHPEFRYTCARLGISVYGLSATHELTAAELGLRPVMTLQAQVVAVRSVPANTGVSYDYTYRTSAETTLALLPVGYADGIPREISGRGVEVLIRGRRYPIVGRVAMDQVIVDLNTTETDIVPGDQAVLFGDGALGELTVDDWAAAANTINYEIISRLGSRIRRVAVSAQPLELS